MPRVDVVVESSIKRSARVMQVEGIFDLEATKTSGESWAVDVPIEDKSWSIGAIVGPSGCGKSTLAREIFGDNVVTGFDWDDNASIVDGFPSSMGVREICGLLSQVGFSSPPFWLRPYRVLSTGQRFRVDVARALAESPQPIVIDEFTSVVDRNVAKCGSAAIAKAIRKRDQRFVAVSCHYDIVDWLQPDWIFEPHRGTFVWRGQRRRPDITLEVSRVSLDAWQEFAPHHYLSHSHHRGARAFVATWNGVAVAFASILPLAGFVGRWRFHRVVTLPDFQGVGAGTKLIDNIASIVSSATSGRVAICSTHPAVIGSLNNSKRWAMTSKPSKRPAHKTLGAKATKRSNRLVATFEYIGDRFEDESRATAMWREKL